MMTAHMVPDGGTAFNILKWDNFSDRLDESDAAEEGEILEDNSSANRARGGHPDLAGQTDYSKSDPSKRSQVNVTGAANQSSRLEHVNITDIPNQTSRLEHVKPEALIRLADHIRGIGAMLVNIRGDWAGVHRSSVFNWVMIIGLTLLCLACMICCIIGECFLREQDAKSQQRLQSQSIIQEPGQQTSRPSLNQGVRGLMDKGKQTRGAASEGKYKFGDVTRGLVASFHK